MNPEKREFSEKKAAASLSVVVVAGKKKSFHPNTGDEVEGAAATLWTGSLSL